METTRQDILNVQTHAYDDVNRMMGSLSRTPAVRSTNTRTGESLLAEPNTKAVSQGQYRTMSYD